LQIWLNTLISWWAKLVQVSNRTAHFVRACSRVSLDFYLLLSGLEFEVTHDSILSVPGATLKVMQLHKFLPLWGVQVSSNAAVVHQFTLCFTHAHSPGMSLARSLGHSGVQFRAMRRAFDAAVLSPSSLAEHATTFARCATRLVATLKRYAAAGMPINMCVPLSDMTMEAIGFTSFGLHLPCLDSGEPFKASLSHSGAASTSKEAVALAAAAMASRTALGMYSPSCMPELTAVLASRSKANTKPVSPWVCAPVTSAEFSDGLVSAARAIFYYLDVTKASPWKLLVICVCMFLHVCVFPQAYKQIQHFTSLGCSCHRPCDYSLHLVLKLFFAALRAIVLDSKTS
jgi:hypothetical protein